MELCIITARTFRLRNEVIRGKKGLIQAIPERMENVLKWNGHVVRMKDRRWHKRIMTCSSGARWRRGRPEVVGKKK